MGNQNTSTAQTLDTHTAENILAKKFYATFKSICYTPLSTTTSKSRFDFNNPTPPIYIEGRRNTIEDFLPRLLFKLMKLAATQVAQNQGTILPYYCKNIIDKLRKEQAGFLSEKFSQTGPTNYNKTLSTVKEFTFDRLEQVEHACDASELHQFMSFTTRSAVCFNVPTPSQHYKGRQKTLEDVYKYFAQLPEKPKSCWERMVAIVGLSGTGKTEMAYKFAAEHRETFPNAVWINAETEHGTLKSFLELAKDLRIVEQDHKKADLSLVVRIYRHIDQQEYGKFLLIFDNAISLQSEGSRFGIYDYLPMEDLPNQRFPYIMITSQATGWMRQFKSIQVGALEENPSLEFFRSFFKIGSPACDGAFKKLHQLLQGHPLTMNLAASQIDHDPSKDSVNELQQRINWYIGKVRREQNKISGDQIDPVMSTSYNNILSILTQMAFKRLQREDDGPEALEVLQIMSFLNCPVGFNDLMRIFISRKKCPHPPDSELQFRLQKLIQILHRFSVARIIKQEEGGQIFEVALYQLVQFIVRQKTDCTKALEMVLCYLAHIPYRKDVVNTLALEEVLPRTRLSSQTLPYVGILACHGIRAACEIVETREPETETAATIWRLYRLRKGITTLNEKALRELLELTKSAEQLKDRQCFAEVVLQNLLDPEASKHVRDDESADLRYLRPKTFDDIEYMVAELIRNVSSFDGSLCDSEFCSERREDLDEKVVAVTVKLSKAFFQVDSPKLPLAVADTWLAVLRMLKYYNPEMQKGIPDFWTKFWREMFKAFNSPDVSQYRIAQLRACLWGLGLTRELIQTFRFVSLTNKAMCSCFTECIDVCLDEMTFKDDRVQQVVREFTEMTEIIQREILNSNSDDAVDFLIDICLVWIKLLLMAPHPTSERLLECLWRFEALNWVPGIKKDGMTNGKIRFRHWYRIPEKYRSAYFQQFIDRFSWFELKGVHELVTFCERMMEIGRL